VHRLNPPETPQPPNPSLGFRSFAALVLAATERGFIHTTKDAKSGDHQIHPDAGGELAVVEE
jgi:hypothetical protein